MGTLPALLPGRAGRNAAGGRAAVDAVGGRARHGRPEERHRVQTADSQTYRRKTQRKLGKLAEPRREEPVALPRTGKPTLTLTTLNGAAGTGATIGRVGGYQAVPAALTSPVIRLTAYATLTRLALPHRVACQIP